MSIRIATSCRSVLLAAAAGLSSGAMAQDLVVNGGFELPVVDGGFAQRLPGSTFGGWTVDNVGQGIVQVASFGQPFAVEGSQSVELNWYVPCGISQALPTIPGDRYVISFLQAGQLNAGPDVKVMRLDWDGNTLDHIAWSRSGSGGQWQRHTYSVVALGSSSVIHFFGETNEDGGPYLDAVSVVHWCIADFNVDGTVDFADYLDFVDALSSTDALADVNLDGVVDFFDYLDYLQYFIAGC